MHFPKCLEPSTEHGSNYILVIYYQSRASKDNFVGLLPERPTKLIVGDIHFGKGVCNTQKRQIIKLMNTRYLML
jgi:hypothetical protein